MGRFSVWFLVSLLGLACADLDSPPLAPHAPSPDATEGAISGSISDPDGRAISGARVLIQPGGLDAISDSEGFYAVEVSVLDDQTAYTVTVAHDNFATVTGAVTLTRANPALVFDVELPGRDEDPPLETLDIAQHTPPGPWGAELTIDFMVDIRNQGPAAISGLVIIDTLDAEFEHEINLDDITVNEEQFPSAIVTLGSDSRSFRIELGDLEPTQDATRAFTLRTPTPQIDGVFCNRVLVSGEADSGPLTDLEINCLVS